MKWARDREYLTEGGPDRSSFEKQMLLQTNEEVLQQSSLKTNNPIGNKKTLVDSVSNGSISIEVNVGDAFTGGAMSKCPGSTTI